MLLWLIEASGVRRELRESARNAADGADTPPGKAAAIRKAVPWSEVLPALSRRSGVAVSHARDADARTKAQSKRRSGASRSRAPNASARHGRNLAQGVRWVRSKMIGLYHGCLNVGGIPRNRRPALEIRDRIVEMYGGKRFRLGEWPKHGFRDRFGGPRRNPASSSRCVFPKARRFAWAGHVRGYHCGEGFRGPSSGTAPRLGSSRSQSASCCLARPGIGTAHWRHFKSLARL